ncbi:MAG: hypothetical protein QOD74_2189 [Variibacter sp.]|jgi:CHASE2 domain-containing sensor protein|nr:hypothetical protein [Variibacter sp.]
MTMDIKTLLTNIWRRVRNKGLRYWITALIVFILGIVLTPYIYDNVQFKGTTFHEARALLFQKLMSLGAPPPTPQFVRAVLVEDDDYWGPALAGRVPIKRDYLADLVTKLKESGARSIALDFDLRLPDPNVMDVAEDYRGETDCLICAIQTAASAGKKIILSTPISFIGGTYTRDPDVYQAYGLCGGRNALRAEPLRCNRDRPPPCQRDEEALQRYVSCGYIALPTEPLEIPGRLPSSDPEPLDSFSYLIARANTPSLTALESAREQDARYTTFISREQFRKAGALISASELRSGSMQGDALRDKDVIVGAHWSRTAIGRGGIVDMHRTVVGEVPGAVLHANFAEAMLGGRTFPKVSKSLLHVIELAFGLVAMIALALMRSVLGKLAVFVALLAALLLLQWTALRFLAIFFDALVPLCGLALHSIYERLLGPHGHHPSAASH